ncbi:MAG: PD-(D/E)XK nuclease family protein [Candidatus Omnitrophica bacterium]|nr:PD-(D/E)XK nuclease family protein [Candidatus Omnitrophota bacterium]
MAVLENIFSWSKSRDEEFQECRRKYYYSRYASWGGWDKNAPKKTRAAYVLKNLKNRWAWKGERVHHAVERVLKTLRSGRTMPLEEAAESLTRQMREDYRSSKAKKNWENPKNSVGLFEHEYERAVPDEVWRDFHRSSVECLRHFFESPFFKELSDDDKTSWLVIEDLEEFDFQDAKVYVKLDFARKKDGKIEILDWKTGKNDAAAATVQIGAYAIYAMKKWGVSAGDIRAYLVNLGVDQPAPAPQAVNEALIEETRKIMAQSIGRMRQLLADPQKNVPLPEDEFPYTDNDRLCNFCSFYKICGKHNRLV